MPAVVKGVVGQIKWHYYVAVALHNYTVTRTDDQWSLRATVVLSDAFKMAQRPLVFVAPTQQGEMRWPIETLAFDRDTHQLVAQLGPPDA